MTLTPAQKSAADEIRKTIQGRGVMALRGYAGTGKTYTLRQAVGQDDNVLLLAPTHKALATASEALPQCEARTIASALGMRMRGRPGSMKLQQSEPHKIRGYDAVIVDEASMVPSDQYRMIAQACEATETALIWVGDPAQLPPVGEAESPVFAKVQHQVMLSDIIRQTEGNPIIAASMMIRQRIEQGKRVTLDDIAEHAGGKMAVMYRQQHPAETTYDAIKSGLEARCIGFTNAAVDRTAAMIIGRLHPTGSLPYVEGDQIFAGAPWVKLGEKKPTLQNNDEGIVLSCEQTATDTLTLTAQMASAGTVTIKAPLDAAAHRRDKKTLASQKSAAQRKAKYAQTSDERTAWQNKIGEVEDALEHLEQWADLRYCYSSTAHKSQGSTFDAAVIDWPDVNKCRDDMTFNRLLYVAVTRPREFLVISA